MNNTQMAEHLMSGRLSHSLGAGVLIDHQDDPGGRRQLLISPYWLKEHGFDGVISVRCGTYGSRELFRFDVEDAIEF